MCKDRTISETLFSPLSNNWTIFNRVSSPSAFRILAHSPESVVFSPIKPSIWAPSVAFKSKPVPTVGEL